MNGPGIEIEKRDDVYRKVAWRLMPFLFAAYVLAYLDRGNVGYAKLGFMSELGFDEAIFGLGGGLFYLGYSLFEVPSNLLLARIGARRTLMRIMLLWGICAALFALMTQPSHYYALRFLLGAAEAGLFPGVLLYLSRWVPVARRARFTALFMAAMPFSGVLGGPLAGGIMQAMDGAAGLPGWQWLFLVEGLPAVLLGFAALWLLADRPADARWLSESEARLIERDVAAEGPNEPSSAHGAWRFLGDAATYRLGLLAGGLVAGLGGVSLWLPTLIRGAGVDGAFQIGVIAAIPYAFGLAAQQMVARLSDRLGNRHTLIYAAGIAASLGWLLTSVFSGTPALGIVFMCFAVAAMFAATGPFWALVTQSFSRSAAPAGIAVVTTMGSLVAFASPALVGWLQVRTGSLDWGLVYYGGLLFAGSLAVILGNRGRVGKHGRYQFHK